jgi:hypothetical protein
MVASTVPESRLAANRLVSGAVRKKKEKEK